MKKATCYENNHQLYTSNCSKHFNRGDKNMSNPVVAQGVIQLYVYSMFIHMDFSFELFQMI